MEHILHKVRLTFTMIIVAQSYNVLGHNTIVFYKGAYAMIEKFNGVIITYCNGNYLEKPYMLKVKKLPAI